MDPLEPNLPREWPHHHAVIEFDTKHGYAATNGSRVTYLIQYHPVSYNSGTVWNCLVMWGIKLDDAMVVRHFMRVKQLLGAQGRSSNFFQKTLIF